MCFNFILIEEEIPFLGVNVVFFLKYEDWEKDISGGWEIWKREMMGLTESTYNAFRAVMWYRKVALGDTRSLNNPFGW